MTVRIDRSHEDSAVGDAIAIGHAAHGSARVFDRVRRERTPRMIGLVLALIVIAIVLSLFGFWIAGVPIAVVGAILFVLFILGWGRRAAEGKP